MRLALALLFVAFAQAHAFPTKPVRVIVAFTPGGVTDIVVRPSSGVRSVAELIAAAKARPGELAYGSAGVGSGGHFSAEKFRIAAGIEVLHVPYKGGADAINDTMAGRLAFTFNTITLALPFIRDGRLIPLGVTSLQRSNLLPETPTFAEGALPGFEFTFWNG